MATSTSRSRPILWYAVSALVIVVVAAGSAALVLSWLFQMQASDTRTYPNAEIRAVRVAVVYCCAHAWTVNANAVAKKPVTSMA